MTERVISSTKPANKNQSGVIAEGCSRFKYLTNQYSIEVLISDPVGLALQIRYSGDLGAL